MGRDKALLPFGGHPMIAHIVARLAPLAEQVLVTTNHPETLAFLDVPCYPDLWPGYGALGGLYTALYYAATPWVAVAACDMPFASPSLFRRAWTLLQQKPQAVAAVPRTARGWEPFHAVYRRSACLGTLRPALQAGEQRVQTWLERMPVLAVPVTGDAEKAVWNVNTPDDYHRALKALHLPAE